MQKIRKIKISETVFSNPIDQIIVLLALFLIFSLFTFLGVWDYSILVPRYQQPKVLYTPPPEPIKYDYPTYNLEYQYYENWIKHNRLIHETITEVNLEYTYLGYYYLTAYCPWECGYNGSNYPSGWTTASGAICHRASYDNRLTEPTTCAIDRSLHSFGTTFYIPDFDRMFVAEDTGGAVRGKWIDLFYEDYGEMASFPTGYYEVYSVAYVYTDKEIEYYDFPKQRGMCHIIYMQDHRGRYD